MRLRSVALALVAALLVSPRAVHAAQTRHEAVIDGLHLTYWTSRPIQPGDVPVLLLHGGPATTPTACA